MKKKIITILISALFASSLSACQPPAKQPARPSASLEENNAQEPSPDADADADAASEDPTVLQPDETEVTPGTSPDMMQEQVLLNYEGITLYAVSWNQEQNALEVRAENTSDQSYILQFSDTSVNNYSISPNFSLNLDAASQVSENALFSSDSLKDCGIQTVFQIQTKVVLLDSVSFNTIYTSDPVTVTTGAVDNPQVMDDSGEVIYDQDGLKLVSKGIVDETGTGKCWKVYISNQTTQDISVETTNIILNDVTLDVLFSVNVPQGTSAVGTMTIFQEDLDKYMIETIDSMEMSLQILNPDDYTPIQSIDDIQLFFPVI